MSPLPQRPVEAALFAQATPLIDVRAPIEFAEGAFPGAVNLPLVDDEERRLIGIRYKQSGQEAAIALGETLVQGERRRQRIQVWIERAQRHPEGALYCFRGGQRSRISQQWLFAASGIAYPRITGGYKAMRRFLLDSLPAQVERPWWVIGGRTGTGKTDFLHDPRLAAAGLAALDLEALAHHRGSAFGRRATPQPTQIDFENHVAVELLRLGLRPTLVEDEGRNVGRVYLPPALHAAISRAPLLVIDAPLSERAERIRRDYVVHLQGEFLHLDPDRGAAIWAQTLRESLDRIERRLGGLKHREIRGRLEEALTCGEAEAHRAWITALLTDYYDPLYDWQLTQKAGRIARHGPAEALRDWLLMQPPASTPACRPY